MIDGLPISAVGPGALLTLVVILILTGRLIPRRTFQDMRDDRDHWRTAAALSEETKRELASQNAELLEAVRTANAFYRSIEKASGGQARTPDPPESGP